MCNIFFDFDSIIVSIEDMLLVITPVHNVQGLIGDNKSGKSSHQANLAQYRQLIKGSASLIFAIDSLKCQERG